MTDIDYVGDELGLFALASNWKRYYAGIISPDLGKSVMEVGAGLGATTAVLCDGSQSEWVCLEPDAALRAEIQAKIRDGRLAKCCRAQAGLISDLGSEAVFDSILYIDVLEHIEHDGQELAAASQHLACGGHLIVLSPAFGFLYSPFDRSIGHYRRYSRSSLQALTPPGCRLERLIYLDSVGLLTSLGNRLLLRQSLPSEKQILFWDRRLVPISSWTDRLVGHSFGRSVLAVWRHE
jgi:hypothetical protein